jgi:hypothetical protein
MEGRDHFAVGGRGVLTGILAGVWPLVLTVLLSRWIDGLPNETRDMFKSLSRDL